MSRKYWRSICNCEEKQHRKQHRVYYVFLYKCDMVYCYTLTVKPSVVYEAISIGSYIQIESNWHYFNGIFSEYWTFYLYTMHIIRVLSDLYVDLSLNTFNSFVLICGLISFQEQRRKKQLKQNINIGWRENRSQFFFWKLHYGIVVVVVVVDMSLTTSQSMPHHRDNFK